MGLIKAIMGATGSTLADQWKEFFYCDAISDTVLMVQGQKKTSSRSSNTKGSDNIISNGSRIAVADGQCMLIIDQGKVVEFCAEPGEFTYDSSSEPSLFCGNLGEGILNTFKTIGARFTFGGDTGRVQKVYYINTKLVANNLFGSANPIPFRVVDSKIGLDVDVSIRCRGSYTFRITDPLLFYTNVSGNVDGEYPKSKIEPDLKREFISALQPAIGKMSDLEIRPNQLTSHVDELREYMMGELSERWGKLRGITLQEVALEPITLPDEDAQMIKDLQRTAVFSNPGMAGAALVGAQADAMKAAASNSAGAMTGFMGLGFAQQAGGMNANQLFAMNQQQQAAQQQAAQQQPAQMAPASAAGGWTCSCGQVNSGKFCENCGSPQPVAADGWTCKCGAVNKGKFCQECGSPKPAGAPLYKCDKCGWEPEDPKNPPKFCPQCGDPFNDNDIQ